MGRMIYTVLVLFTLCLNLNATNYMSNQVEEIETAENVVLGIGDELNESDEGYFQEDKKCSGKKKSKTCKQHSTWEKHFEDVFPGEIPGPKSYNDRIAVVGAGPSGVHMALLLKKKGFKNIEIFEATDEIGGKSKSVNRRGVTHDMGTVYITADYQEVLKLIKTYTPGKLKAPEIASVWLNATWDSNGINFTSYAFGVLRKKHPQLSLSDLQVYVIGLVTKYIGVHRKLFGEYLGDLMPEPDKGTLHAIRGSFMDFLVRNKLEDLRDLFIATFSLQGYGQLDEVPALYGLMWHTPLFMKSLLLTLSGKSGAYHLLEGGFQQLWQNIVSKEKLKVRKGCKVVGLQVVKYHGKNLFVYLRYTHDRHYHLKKYDFVIWSPPIRDSLKYFRGGYYYNEKKLFSQMTNSYYTTTLLDEEGSERSDSPVDWFYGNIYSKKDNLVWGTRDTYSMLNDVFGEKYRKKQTETGSDKKKQLRTLVVYQFSHQKERPSRSHLQNALADQFNQMGGNKRTIVEQYVWKYFVRFTQDQIQRGYHWRALELQGKQNIWFVGGSLSFESVKSVVEYNQLLVNRMESIYWNDDDDDGEVDGDDDDDDDK